jgi:hypothetical protein
MAPSAAAARSLVALSMRARTMLSAAIGMLLYVWLYCSYKRSDKERVFFFVNKKEAKKTLLV